MTPPILNVLSLTNNIIYNSAVSLPTRIAVVLSSLPVPFPLISSFGFCTYTLSYMTTFLGFVLLRS